MHSYTSENGTSFSFNSDFSGNIRIFTQYGPEIIVSANDILEFVAYNYIATKRVSKIEDMEWDEILSS